MRHLEEDAQIRIFRWANSHTGIYPELKLLHHIPNGGWRTKVEAVRLKEAGAKSGVPDLFLPVSRMGFHGLYIELKIKGGRISDAQKEWINALNQQGFMAVVCFGDELAIAVLEAYLRCDNGGVEQSISTTKKKCS